MVKPDNPGTYYRFSYGDIEFFMLDDRYYRSPNGAEDDGTKTMLGDKQWQWLKHGLKDIHREVEVHCLWK
jgi:alkaline phosphatase D